MSMDQNPPSQPPPASPAPSPAAAPPPATSSNMLLAALGYPIWIIALIVALTEKNDQEVKYHGWNALFWGIAYIVVIVALGIVGVMLHNVPGIGRLFRLLVQLVPLAFLALSIIFAVNAYNRKPVNIPVISDMARKQVGM